MNTKKISELPHTIPSSEDYIPFLQAGVNYAAPVSDFAHLVGGVVRFSNIISDATVLLASTSSALISIVYIESKHCFVAKSGRNYYNNWLTRHLYQDDNNMPHNRIFIDNYNQPYYFDNSQNTLIPIALSGCTSKVKVNTAIKELFLYDINGNDLTSQGLYVGLIFRRWADTSTGLLKCQIGIYNDNDVLVAQYFDSIATDGHQPPSFVEINPLNDSGITGYAVVKWDEVAEGLQWYDRSLYGKAYLNSQCFCVECNPIIYLKTL